VHPIRTLIILVLAGAEPAHTHALGPALASQPAAGVSAPFAAVGPVAPDPRNTPVDSIDIAFAAPIKAKTFSTADLMLTRTTGAGAVALPLDRIPVIIPLGESTFRLKNLGVLTTPDGTYRLTVAGAGIEDSSGEPLAGEASDVWRMDATGPLVSAVGPVSPQRRTAPVASVDIRFFEPISPTTLTAADLALTRDGEPQSLEAVTITPLSPSVYRLGGLGALTQVRGSYTLTVDPSEVADEVGNLGSALFTRSTRWAVVVPPGVASVGPVSPALRNSPVDSVDVTLTEPVSATTFTPSDLSLTRDGVSLALGSAHVTPLGGAQYRVEGLGSLTGGSGRYTLTADAAGVIDLDDGIGGSGAVSTTWTTDTVSPTALLSAGDISAGGGRPHIVSVVYSDNLALDEDSIDAGDITVRGPGGITQTVALLGVLSLGEAQRIATYQVSAPGGAWDPTDRGEYVVALGRGAVQDTAGNSVPERVLGSFAVSVVPAVDLGARYYLPVVSR
jgi:hypothetical protein